MYHNHHLLHKYLLIALILINFQNYNQNVILDILDMKMFLYDVVVVFVVVVIVVFVFVLSDKDEGLFYLCLSESEFSVSCKRAL